MKPRIHSLQLVGILTLAAGVLLALAGAGRFRSIASPAQNGCTVTPITIGQVVSGALTSSDCRSPVRGSGYYADRYSFTGATGTAVSIITTLRGYDGWIILIAPDGTTLVNQDSENFPGGGFYNLPASGTYIFEVTSYSSGQTGNYAFVLTAGTPGCSYALSSTSQSVAAAGGTGSASISTSSPCLWTAVSDSSWITVTSGASTTGNGTVGYTVAANNTATPRSGQIVIAGQILTISQLGSASLCLVTPIAIGQTVRGTLSSSDCTSVVRGANYLADRYSFSGTAGTGLAVVVSTSDFSPNMQLIGPNGLVAAAGGYSLSSGFFNLPATGTYTLEYSSSSMFQTGSYALGLTTGSPNCSFNATPTSQIAAAAASTGTVSVSTGASCTWTTISDSNWLTVNSGGSATGNGTAGFAAAANPTADPRSAVLYVAGQAVSVTQLGSAATCLISPIIIGQAVSGTISSSDCTSVVRGNNYLADRFSFSGTTGAGIAVIALANIGLNLQLIGPNGLVANSGSSRIPSSGFFNLPATGTYLLEVSTSSRFDSGSYSFNLIAGTAGCSYNVSSSGQTVAAAGGVGSVNVTANNGCLWSAISDSDWLTVTAGSSANGNGTVSYAAAANPNATPRSARLTVAEQTVTISQLGSTATCSVTPITIGQIVTGDNSSGGCYSVVGGVNYYANRHSFSGTAGTAVAIQLQYASYSRSHLYLIGPNGLVLAQGSSIPSSGGFFSLPATGTYIIEVTAYSAHYYGSYTLTLTAGTANCVYTPTPTSQAFAATGATGTVTVAAGSSCQWTAISDSDWITINSGASVTGAGAVAYTVPANTSNTPRYGKIFVAGQTINISQLGNLGNCPVTPITAGQIVTGNNSSSNCFSVVGGTNYYANRHSFSGTAGNAVAIQLQYASYSRSYLYLIGPNGLVLAQGSSIPSSGGFFSLPATGTYILEVTAYSTHYYGDYTLTLTPGTVGCSYAVTPASQSVGSAGGANSVNVGTGSVCVWTAVSDSDWITINSGASATGSGAIAYTVAANTTGNPRTGKLYVAGQAVTVSQLSDISTCLVTPIIAGQVANGSLSSSDCLSVVQGNSYYADRYSFTGAAGSAVSISLTNSGFYNYLYLIGPSGTVIAANYSKIPETGVLGLPTSGTYIIEVTAYSTSNQTGSYALGLDVCNYAISPASQSLGVNGGTGSITVTTTSGCTWTANSSVTWITLASGSSSGTGNGSVGYTVAANGGGARTGTLTVAGQTFTVTQAGNNPAPTVSSLSPATATAGDPAMMLTVTGTNFLNSSVVKWNGNDRPTTFVSATQLKATIPATDMAAPGAASVTVFNPTPGGGASSPLSFAINANPRAVRVMAVTGSPGGTVAVPIELAAQGSENSLSFSLTFDPAVLSNPQAALGSDATGGSLNTNPSQTAQGRLGMVINLPAGQQFSAGGRQIAVVTFTVAANAATAATNVGFGDQPVPREVADAIANTLAANYTPGAITIAQGYEADVTPAPSGNGSVTVSDWVRIGRFITGVETPAAGSEFQRADCAPRASFGDGRISLTDYVQAGRYAAGLDPLTPAGGPATQTNSLATTEPQQGKNLRTPPSLLRLAQVGHGALTLELDAQGVENALAFSLRFDPAAWRFAAAEAGRDAREATLQLNLGEAARGRIGIVLALPAGQTFAAGGRQIARLRFAPIVPSGALSYISFADQPVARELVDVAADVLPASYAVRIGEMEARAVAVVSAASFDGEELARGSIAAAFGENLATKAQVAATMPLPIELAGTRVTITDSAGVEHSASLFFVAPEQVNFLLPEEAAPGLATIRVTSSDGSLSLGLIQIVNVAPGLLTANADGQGAASGVLVRVKADGSQQFEPIAEFDAAQNRFIARPLALEDENEQVYLTLFASGLRFRDPAQTISIRIGEQAASLLYAGAQGEYAGLDQVNVLLPRSLMGRGEVSVTLMVDGKTANPVRINLR